ncbi:MAG TPA: hypothetical protein VG245_05015 [Candidatus Dormibacteraeota bacterium]|jgi:hypothetical protein|nr:hypothetical protein [Candidatus Dormibacteraeota bacterium]
MKIGGGITGAIFGLIFGIGLGIFLSQMNTISMQSKSSLVVPAVCLVLGFLIGAFGGRKKKDVA